ncbi:hypothetical protein [Streptomyces sp. NPDC005438]|uniref:hypothetical protein n=1 Tax=Streptomyces sp. NPDC005438 TaxID=3156880 RepID=UPI0033BB7A7C
MALLAVVAITGAYFYSKDDGSKDDEAKPKKKASASPSPSEEDDPTDNPREGAEDQKAVVPGWQPVTNPKWYSVFDVPKTKDWEIAPSDTIVGFTDKKGKPFPGAGMSAPAYFKKGWCKDSQTRVTVGTKGAQGSRNTKEAAKIAAENFAIAGWDEEQKGKLGKTKVRAFKNTHGIKGHAAQVTLRDAPAKGKCGVPDAKVTTISWINSNDDLAIWVFMADDKVKKSDQVSDGDLKKMMASLRSLPKED